MIEKIKNFYLGKATFIFAAIVAMLSWGIENIGCLASAVYRAYFPIALCFFLLTAGLYLAYRYAKINAQKMLFGALLMMFVVDNIERFKYFLPIATLEASVMIGIVLLLSVLMFISHLFQQEDHKGKSLTPLISQLCGLVMIINIIYVLMIAVLGKATLCDVLFAIAYFFTQMMIICMETRIHKYKNIRLCHIQSGTWTERERAEAKKLFKI